MNLSTLQIRAKTTADESDIEHVVQAAFADGTETSDFVANVRTQAVVCLEQVVTDGGRIIAHAQYAATPLTVGGVAKRAAYLACLSVDPTLHRRGIGSLLVRHGLGTLQEAGMEVAMVLGSPQYYPRFGFSSELGRKIKAPHNGRGDAFMALAPVPGALDAQVGRAEFPAVLVPSEN